MRRVLVACLLSAVVSGGCTSGGGEEATSAAPRVLQAGAPGEPSHELDPEEAASLSRELDEMLSHTDADVTFMQGMILHHVQALRMTRLVPDRTSREDVPLFAERIDLSQEEELDLMRRWLEARDEEVPSLLAGHEHVADGDHGHAAEGELMPGMLTAEELLELEAATGEEFDRLFLQGMIRHHYGALTMVDELYAAGGGNEPELARFANHVYGDQSIEISRAESMLAEMDGDEAP